MNFCKSIFVNGLLIFFFLCISSSVFSQVAYWLTTNDGSVTFSPQANSPSSGVTDTSLPTITIDANKTYQKMDGFGFTLTGGSAALMHRMNADSRAKLLHELFSTEDTAIGISYLRVSIGASDMDERVFSYDDMPDGKTDMNLAHFSLAADDSNLVPILKEILAINPKIKILGSPWSAPVWMKDNGDTRGGSLKPEYENVYAKYLVTYIQQMKKRGIVIDAVTVQNEPLHPGNNPSMFMKPEQQRDFIKNSLGPVFKAAGITTKIIVYDHNLDRIDYPLTILKDAQAARYVDGSAFHLYAGTIDEMKKVHDSFPDKNVYFTEQWTSGKDGAISQNLVWHQKNLEIGAPRNWSKVVLEWNLAIDPNFNPHTDRGGCNICLGAVTIDGNTFIKNSPYYNVAHSSRFVRPGSVRIASNEPEGLPNVAYKTPDGKIVLVLLNESKEEKSFNVSCKGKQFRSAVPAGSAATYVW